MTIYAFTQVKRNGYNICISGIMSQWDKKDTDPIHHNSACYYKVTETDNEGMSLYT